MTTLNQHHNATVGATPCGCPIFETNAVGVSTELRTTTQGRPNETQKPNTHRNENKFFHGGVR
jgi:hypothetical protein